MQKVGGNACLNDREKERRQGGKVSKIAYFDLQSPEHFCRQNVLKQRALTRKNAPFGLFCCIQAHAQNVSCLLLFLYSDANVWPFSGKSLRMDKCSKKMA